ncbi:MAG: sulfotransferase [Pseudomonadota bacterium]
MVPSPKLDFIIAGVQKAGTTALAAYLDQHPDVALPAAKELHHFRYGYSAEKPPPKPDADLAAAFGAALGTKICGEATPAYLYWPHALELIADHNPDVTLILTLRHPVARAYSAWSMEVRRGRETLSFSDAIRSGRERVSRAPGGVHMIFSYVERGFYSAQIRRLLTLFPRGQVAFLRSDEIAAGRAALQSLLARLGAAPFAFEPIDHNVFPSSLAPEPGLAEDFAYLQDVFAEDLADLGGLTGLDVADWVAGPPPVEPLNALDGAG